jgi:hypothetical protein
LTIAYDEVTGHETKCPQRYEDTRNILFSIMMKRIHDYEIKMGPHKAMQPLQFIGSAAGSTYTSELKLTLKNASKYSVSDNDFNSGSALKDGPSKLVERIPLKVLSISIAL